MFDGNLFDWFIFDTGFPRSNARIYEEYEKKKHEDRLLREDEEIIIICSAFARSLINGIR